MKKLFVFTAVAGLTLVSAAPPSHWRSTAAERQWSGNGYPPCTRTRTDRCIQLYERGVATRANLALNERLGMDNRVMAMGGPYEPVYGVAPGDEQDAWAEAPPPRAYPPCSGDDDDRCIQSYERGAGDW